MRALIAPALFIAPALLIASAVYAQQSAPKPVFETASIKMTAPSGGGSHSHERDTQGMFRGSMTLKSYIMAAYNMKPYQVTGGPDWIDDTTYEIVAKLDRASVQDLPAGVTPRQRGEALDATLHEALQSLLAERFQLKFHHEAKDMPSYVLTVARNGFKLKEARQDHDCGTNSTGDGTTVKFSANCVDMQNLTGYLARQMDRPVFDETHIQGLYTFKFDWARDDLKNAAPADQIPLPSIFTALQQYLGLKLESQKVPVDIIVVDSAARPSEN